MDDHLDNRLTVLLSKRQAEAVSTAARKNYIRPSTWVRQVISQRLASDGVDFNRLEKEAS
jgi:hypothetical protein